LEGVAAGLGLTVRGAFDALKAGRWALLVSGDDTLLVLPPNFSRTAYLDVGASHGFTRKLEDYPVFLMTWLNPDGSEHGLASRAAMRTVTAERRPAGPHAELLGARMRWEKARGDPTFFICWDSIKDNPLFDMFGVATMDDLRRVVDRDAFQSAFRLETEHTPQGPEAWLRALEGWFAGDRALASNDDRVSLLLQRFGALRAWSAGHLTAQELVSKAASFDWRAYCSQLGKEANADIIIRER
jgi:hypothetical protein